MKKLNTVFFATAWAAMSFIFATAIFATASLHSSVHVSKYRQASVTQAEITGDQGNANQGDQERQNGQSVLEKPGTIPNSMLPRREPFTNYSSEQKPTETLTLVDIVSTDPSLSTLAKVIKAADLAKALSGPGPFTIFAPNDAAFAKLSPNTLSDLLRPENKNKLTAILTYHVVPGKITADNFKNMKVRTLHGKPLEIKVNGNEVTVNSAKVDKNQITGANGIIYITDTVLQP